MRVSIRFCQFLMCLSLAGAALSAHAFERTFPQNAKRGVFSLENYPTVTMDGKVRKMSPGSWIKNVNNTIDVPEVIPRREYTVNYIENIDGDIHRVWILSDEEAKKPAPADEKK